MTLQQEPREFLSGKLAQVDVARIEKELRGLWKQATNDEAGIAGDVVRAVSFTLILFGTDESAEHAVSQILDDIMTYHPCRAILAYYREGKPHAMDAWVTARCHLSGKKHVCSEQITVLADGGSADELASVVSPLVLADLPVVLWWRSRNLAHAVMNALLDCTRKVIFDSHYEPFEIKILQQAADLVIERADCVWLSDLNWRRLDGWRRSLAEAFDGFPMDVDYLKRISGVTISVVPDKTGNVMSAQALLLAGWLASRLGWHYERENTTATTASFRSGKENFIINFQVQTDNSPSVGSITSVSVSFDDGRSLLVKLERSGTSSLITAQEENTESKESTRVDSLFSEGVLIGQELENMSRDRIFEQSLILAGEITRFIK